MKRPVWAVNHAAAICPDPIDIAIDETDLKSFKERPIVDCLLTTGACESCAWHKLRLCHLTKK